MAFAELCITSNFTFLTGGSHPNQASPSSARAAEGVLAERFARGEIDDDEYRQRMTTLREHR